MFDLIDAQYLRAADCEGQIIATLPVMLSPHCTVITLRLRYMKDHAQIIGIDSPTSNAADDSLLIELLRRYNVAFEQKLIKNAPANCPPRWHEHTL